FMSSPYVWISIPRATTSTEFAVAAPTDAAGWTPRVRDPSREFEHSRYAGETGYFARCTSRTKLCAHSSVPAGASGGIQRRASRVFHSARQRSSSGVLGKLSLGPYG